MALRDPVAVYNAANNLEAQLICNFLRDAGIEAYPTEDVSLVGTWMLGLLPEIHKPQIWTDRADVNRVQPMLEDYERRQGQRREAEAETVATGAATVEATCAECGEQSTFPAGQKGTVQDCPRCGAYMDIEDAPDAEEWWRKSGGSENAEDK